MAKLREYEKKRDFAKTPEPAGGHDPGQEGARFVVQEHSATRLHWDLRLEHEGALASWAVPNGIPQDPEENRKAVHTEDHPLEYLEFHGEIPKGEYGAGTMKIWDRGTYECHKWEDRKVVITFHGERLKGRYALFQAGRGDKDWMIHRMDPAEAGREPMPEGLVPMLARLAKLPAEDGGWAYEIKWDGVRALAYCQPGRLRLESRNLNDVTAQYPELRALTRALGAHDAVLDGELVAFDEAGRPDFGRLQQRMHQSSESVIRRRMKSHPVTYVIFDLLHLDGRSLMDEPYTERRRLLEGLELNGAHWQTPAYAVENGEGLLAAGAEKGIEGLVVKRLDSRYEPGKRGGSWLKVKNTSRQELVIGGWLPGEGRRRQQLGALLVGFNDVGPDGEWSLRYAGRVGTGFTEADLAGLMARLRPLEQDSSPFTGRQPPRSAVFVRPELVAEVEFTEWTTQRMLRHPSFKGLRDDKAAEEVVAERPEQALPPGAQVDGAAQEEGQGARPAAANGSSVSATARALPGGKAEVELEGRTLRLSNLDKVLYPRTGFTKGRLIDYYARVAPVLLPHLHGRPLTLKRYPDGVEGEHFYEKRCPSHRPDWVTTAAIWSERHKTEVDYCIVNELPTLVWAANLADIELHTSLSRAEHMDRPDSLVFDLDPGEGAGILDCCQVGLWIRGMLAELGLSSYAKTSGSKGLQLYLPLNAEQTYGQTKPFARAVAEILERQFPELVVSRMTKSLRPGKVLVDWSQNDPHKTTVCVYSLRARERPTVSTPVSWEEVEEALEAQAPERLVFDSEDVLARIQRDGDLFAPLLSQRQELPGTASGPRAA
jgi:bifunctional non-homologous end joining protein LigD